MHESATNLIVNALLKHRPDRSQLHVGDVGAFESGEGLSLRTTIEGLGFAAYHGIDIRPNRNVEYVVPEVGDWSQIIPAMDVIVSANCIEHTRWPWVWMCQIRNIVKVGGLVVVVGPTAWRIHRHPVDCWRILPDGMTALFQWAGLKTLEVGLGTANVRLPSGEKTKADCWGVARRRKKRKKKGNKR